MAISSAISPCFYFLHNSRSRSGYRIRPPNPQSSQIQTSVKCSHIGLYYPASEDMHGSPHRRFGWLSWACAWTARGGRLQNETPSQMTVYGVLRDRVSSDYSRAIRPAEKGSEQQSRDCGFGPAA
ncbi:uncharacterized protein An09g02110 [Aspergillus niger]|uniref:Contig An09c0050, genomic contig n=2 Tax=Aspergillus niger TaxID=5061 RepID=A2QTH3_ASPNC|nr:uncharacterized protein An09g02110 [Aspergillus niger]CAK40148.1 unnamed protein product [Aspergillus niger]